MSANKDWLKDVLLDRKTLFFMLLVGFVCMQDRAFCDSGAEDPAMKALSNSFVDDVLNPFLIKIVLTLGGAWGFIRCVMAGSFVPLALWGGLGFMPMFLKAMINFFTKLKY